MRYLCTPTLCSDGYAPELQLYQQLAGMWSNQKPHLRLQCTQDG